MQVEYNLIQQSQVQHGPKINLQQKTIHNACPIYVMYYLKILWDVIVIFFIN